MQAAARGTALAALVAVVLAGCSAQAPTPAQSASSGQDAFACGEPTVGALPDWARGGFSPPDQPVAHLMSVDGHVVAVPFGWPLRAPQPEGRANKILWVADRSEPGPMVIRARRETDAAPVRVELPNGPGPSIIDLPEPGCWRLDLSWPGGSDRIHLTYLG